MAVRQEVIRDRLTARFGEGTDPDGERSRRIAQIFIAWSARKTPLEDLESRLEDELYAGLRRSWGDEMVIPGPDGWRRITTEDLADGADELLELLFSDLPEHAANCELVRNWAMKTGSPAAMRVLCARFSGFQAPEERALMRRILNDRS